MMWQQYQKKEPAHKVNEKITAAQVLLIDENGAPLGIKSKWDAIEIARARDLDLVEVGPNSNPPVCKIIDYGKYKYEIEKKQQKEKARNKAGELKEIRLSPQTDEHDFNTKVEKIKKFVEKGCKVRITVKMRGRENIYQDRAISQIKRVKEALNLDFEQTPVKLGPRFTAILTKSKVNKDKGDPNKVAKQNAEN